MNENFRDKFYFSHLQKQEVKSNKGITLIALVITIIVLLILAGVSISMLVGENGIITQAQKAKNETERAAQKEANSINEIENMMNEMINENMLTDKTPGVMEGDGSTENPYIINSIEDLVVFAYDVRNGKTYKDKTIKLGRTLDFSNNNSYVEAYRSDYGEYGYEGKLKEMLSNNRGFLSIGKSFFSELESETKKGFEGVFDGNNNKIKNMMMHVDKNTAVESDKDVFASIAMFSINKGEIKNLGIENIRLYVESDINKFTNVGSLIGINFGKVTNCYSTGTVECKSAHWSVNIGGLVGANNGRIECSYNEANIKTINIGNVNTQIETRIGGLLGINEIEGILDNIYNIGTVDSKAPTNMIRMDIYCGGLTGRNLGTVQNGYNIGDVKYSGLENEQLIIFIGSTIGSENFSEASNKNLYYLQNTVNGSISNLNKYGIEKTKEQLKTQEFLRELKGDSQEDIWRIDENQNNGYPIIIK